MKTQNKKIVHVVAYYPPHLGGMENCAHILSNKLVEKGHSVDVYTSTIGTNNAKNVTSKNYNVFYLKSYEFAHTPVVFSLFYHLLKMDKPALIHLHVSHAIWEETVYLISKIRKIPYVAHVHMDVPASGPLGFLLIPYKRFFLRPVLRNATKLVCLSEKQRVIIAQKYDIDPNSIEVLPNGVGDEYFINRQIVTKSVPNILYVGRLALQKNVPRLIEAVALLKHKVQVTIVGEGEDRERVEAIIAKHSLKNIQLVGLKTGKDLIAYYKEADLFIIPSNKEGLPLVLMEAMAAALPIVASDIPGVSDMLGDSGVLIKNKTPETFARAIDDLLADQQKRKTLSTKAQSKASKFNWKIIVSQLETIYNKCTL